MGRYSPVAMAAAAAGLQALEQIIAPGVLPAARAAPKRKAKAKKRAARVAP